MIDVSDIFTPEVIASIHPVLISEMLARVQPIPKEAFEAAHQLMKFKKVEE